MKVSPVSFGQVIAVTGKPKKIEQLRRETSYMANVARVDYTEYYAKSYSTGLLGDAVRNKELIDFYITGKDYDSFTKKERGWETMAEVSCQLDKYYNLGREGVNAVKLLISESR